MRRLSTCPSQAAGASTSAGQGIGPPCTWNISSDREAVQGRRLCRKEGMKWREMRNIEIVTKIQNVLDRHYSEAFGFPAPPVNFVAGVKLEF